MLRKNISGLVAVVFILLSVSLYAMDMQRVNELAEMIKSGRVSGVSKNIRQQIPHRDEAEPVKAEKVVTDTSNDTDTDKGILSGEGVSEVALGLRKTNLYSEEWTVADKTEYISAAPGTSSKLQRAFENAPPMIPHSVEGLLPITRNNNACLGCHMPDVAEAAKATPIPPSHLTNFRPMTELGANGEVLKEGLAISNTSDIKIVARKLDKLYPGRYNCSQCHAPQSKQEAVVKNTFKPDFRYENANRKSNLIDTINEGVE